MLERLITRTPAIRLLYDIHSIDVVFRAFGLSQGLHRLLLRYELPLSRWGDFSIYYLLEIVQVELVNSQLLIGTIGDFKLTIYSFAGRVGVAQSYSAKVTRTAYPLDGISAMLVAIAK